MRAEAGPQGGARLAGRDDALPSEQRFMAEMDAAAVATDDLAPVLAALEDWLCSLGAALAAARLAPAGLREDGALARQAAAVNAALAACGRDWPAQRAALQPAQALARDLDHAVILLVFGKFNAGKSSLCNFIAARFAGAGRAARFFHLHDGALVDGAGPFAEGATETTARLQGVRLGPRLVLLDTPGLHSTSAANAALTRRFADSADGVLWLTSSAAPGQVQELEELAAELRRAKPLLPVVTRSDVYEEDEIDGGLVQALRNKSATNRAEQEADVAARARAKLAAMGLDPALLRPPVSLSVHMARSGDPAALTEAGVERLFEALRQLARPALAYRRRKPAEVLVRHLDEAVLGRLRHQAGPALAQLSATLDAARSELEHQGEQVEDTVWRAAMALLPDLLDQHAAARDVAGVCRALSACLGAALARAMDAHLPDYGRDAAAPRDAIPIAGDAGFEEAAGGAGVDYARLHAALGREVRDWVLRETASELARCAASLDRLAEGVACLNGVVDAHAASLDGIRTGLRAAASSSAVEA